MARMQYRAERRAARYTGGGAWIVGVALIALGAIFMLQNMGTVLIHNWWALFILLPALGSFATAYGAYRNSGRLTVVARSSLIGGLILTAIAGFFLLDLDWARWWPTLLILVGIGALTNAVLPD
jgi:peptidoglycan/LPS O-acetylase OafA/YrhL